MSKKKKILGDVKIWYCSTCGKKEIEVTFLHPTFLGEKLKKKFYCQECIDSCDFE